MAHCPLQAPEHCFGVGLLQRQRRRWQIEFTSRTSYNGGTIKAASTYKFGDNRIWFQATFGF